MADIDLTAAVNAAARAMYESVTGESWGKAADMDRHEARQAVLPAIDIAAPIIERQVREQVAARAWREGYYTGKRDYAGSVTGGVPISTPNPYGVNCDD